MKIGTASRFLTPEGLDLRHAVRTSSELEGLSFVTMRREYGRVFLIAIWTDRRQ